MFYQCRECKTKAEHGNPSLDPFPFHSQTRQSLNDDTGSSDRLFGGVVIHRESCNFIPNLDPERVCGQHACVAVVGFPLWPTLISSVHRRPIISRAMLRFRSIAPLFSGQQVELHHWPDLKRKRQFRLDNVC